jgi:predicted TIM-barrel fold metal-dependent hydrolase
MLETYDNLWLDSTMTLSDYLPFDGIPNLAEMRADRIIFGSDFPSLPYAWDREIKQVGRLNLSPERLSGLLYKNALEFYSINVQES